MCIVIYVLYPGIFTGSVYGESYLIFKGRKRTDGTVIAVKTHRPVTDSYDRAILIYRGIQATLIADSNRKFSNNTSVPERNIFEGKGGELLNYYPNSTN